MMEEEITQFEEGKKENEITSQIYNNNENIKQNYIHTSNLDNININSPVALLQETNNNKINNNEQMNHIKKNKLNNQKRKRYCPSWCFKSVKLGYNVHRLNHIPEDEYLSGPREGWQFVYEIVFESSTLYGQMIDLILLILITISVISAILDSVKSIRENIGGILVTIEVILTIIFTVECIIRMLCIKRPKEYLLSFMGIVDIASILPTYIAFFIPLARPLMHLAVLRVYRILRVFRVLKLLQFVEETELLAENIHDNRRRITVFLFSVFTVILVIGCAMYLIEGESNGFDSIPISLYWTVVTMTTVGYGDIAPKTVVGRCLATFVMLSGYGIIACPLVLTGNGTRLEAESIAVELLCPRCSHHSHQIDSNFCRICGNSLKKLKTIRPELFMEPTQTNFKHRRTLKKRYTKYNGVWLSSPTHKKCLSKESSVSSRNVENDLKNQMKEEISHLPDIKDNTNVNISTKSI